jgi:putative FmdB family regulatory protein
MPLYAYDCDRCGPFQEWRSMSESGDPFPCPRCRRKARRAISAPRLGIPGALKQAHARNEKSQHEPEVVRRKAGGGHDHGHRHAQKSRHPWMVGH